MTILRVMWGMQPGAATGIQVLKCGLSTRGSWEGSYAPRRWLKNDEHKMPTHIVSLRSGSHSVWNNSELFSHSGLSELVLLPSQARKFCGTMGTFNCILVLPRNVAWDFSTKWETQIVLMCIWARGQRIHDEEEWCPHSLYRI